MDCYYIKKIVAYGEYAIFPFATIEDAQKYLLKLKEAWDARGDHITIEDNDGMWKITDTHTVKYFSMIDIEESYRICFTNGEIQNIGSEE